MESPRYIPGVCNIGPAEISMRYRFGYFFLVITVIAIAALYRMHEAPNWALLLFVPATISALGFLQAGMHFCVDFGMRGLFNVSEELRKTEGVEQAEWRKKDQRKAIGIIAMATLVGVVIATLTFLSLP